MPEQVLACYNGPGASTLEFKIEAVAENVGMSLRRVNPTVAIGGVDTTYHSPYGYPGLQPDAERSGSATISITARVSGAAASSSGLYSYVVTVPIAVFSDHPFVDPTNALHAWFFRNRWHEVSYYAVAAGHAPSGAGSCTTNVDCLFVARYFDSNRQPTAAGCAASC
ncbi:MAG: hypothetical protein RML56_01290 [Burkholderiales bacterium]|nr:hypothetical protein [Burkholderiales bacterium]